MKQLLVRVPDDVHARLGARAARQERSTNALVTEILEEALADESGDARARLRARARARGVLAVSPSAQISVADRARALDQFRGRGPVLDELFEDGR